MNKKGFTLVEILAVIAIMAVLSVSAIMGVNAIINSTRNRLAQRMEETIADVSLSYFENKKQLYIEPCTDSEGNFVTIGFDMIKKLNDDLRKTMNENGKTTPDEKYTYAKNYINNLKENVAEKEIVGLSYFEVNSARCFDLVTVGDLIDEGYLVDNDNLCNRSSVIAVYQKGDSRDKSGSKASVQESNICNGKRRVDRLPLLTVSPESDDDPGRSKNIRISVTNEKSDLKSKVRLSYAWSKDNKKAPSAWHNDLEIDTNGRKGYSNLLVDGFKGEYYLWIKSNESVDNSGNYFGLSSYGPYVFIKEINVTYIDNEGTGCNSEVKKVAYGGLYGKNVDGEEDRLCIPESNALEFVSWEYEGTEINDSSPVEVLYDHAIIAKWQEKRCKLTLDTNGGNNCSPKTISRDVGEEWGDLCEPSKPNAKFVEWNTNSDGSGDNFTGGVAQYNDEEETDCDMTVYAVWEEPARRLNYKNDCGKVCEPSYVDALVGEEWGELCDPTDGGLFLTGWNTKPNGSGSWITPITTVSENLDAYAICSATEIKYKVTFDSNGGSACTPSEIMVTAGKSIGTPLCAPTFTGEDIFIEWNTERDGSGETFDENTLVFEDITVYAQPGPPTMRKLKYVTYSGDKNTKKCKTKSKADGSKWGTLCSPSRGCTAFGGWYTGEGCTGTKIDANTIVNSDLTVYPCYKYTVTYKANGGTGTTSSTSCAYKKPCKINSNSFTYSNGTFQYWIYQLTVKKKKVNYTIKPNEILPDDRICGKSMKAVWKVKKTWNVVYSASSSKSTKTSSKISNLYTGEDAVKVVSPGGGKASCSINATKKTISCTHNDLKLRTATNSDGCVEANQGASFYYNGKCLIRSGHSPLDHSDKWNCGSYSNPLYNDYSHGKDYHHCPPKNNSNATPYSYCKYGNGCYTAGKTPAKGGGSTCKCWAPNGKVKYYYGELKANYYVIVK